MSAQSETQTLATPTERGEDYRARSFALFCLLIAVLIGGSIGLSVAILRATIEPSPAEQIAASPESTPRLHEPRLQTDPLADLAALRQAQQDILQSSAWIDRPAGIVRIPISQAIDYAVAHGLPSLQSNSKPEEP